MSRILLILLVCSSISLYGLTWNSNVAVSGAWNVAANWDQNSVPILDPGGNTVNIVSTQQKSISY